MPYCPQCGRYHTPDTGGCRFQTTIAAPAERAPAPSESAKGLAERITTLRQEDYQFESPMWFKVGKQLDDATAEIERFVQEHLEREWKRWRGDERSLERKEHR
jgi:hypothetical protein